MIDKLTEVGREATKYEFNDLPNSPDCQNGINFASEELIHKIINYDLNSYYQSNLEEKRSFFKVIPYEMHFRYSSDMISSPLTKISFELQKVAVKIYEELLTYMGDIKGKMKPYEYVKNHLKLVINSTEDLKDEAYVQILKQIKDNTDQ